MNNNYIVKKGDTLESIAEKFNIKIEDLLNSNKNNMQVESDQVLIIPSNNNESFFDYYTIKKGDTLYTLGNIYNIDPLTLANINGLEKGEYLYPNNKILVPKPNTVVYVTKENDNIYDLLQKYDLNKAINNDNKLYLVPDQLIVYKEK